MRFFKTIAGILILFSLLGCIPSIERGVADNVFYSTGMPEIRIKAGPDFIYEGDAKSIISSDYEAGEGSFFDHTESYVFLKKGDEQSLIRIQISELRDSHGYWISDKKKGEGIISSDFITIGNQNYLETFGVDFSDGTYYMYRRLGRIVGPRKKHYFELVYVQSISSKKAIMDWSLKNWTGKSGLSAEQIDVFSTFAENSQRDVQIN